MKEISLTKKKVALVDDRDYGWLSSFSWRASDQGSGSFYAKRRKVDSRSTSDSVYMHREILGAPKGVLVDHINRNPLDNQRSNLRLCNAFQNVQNVGLRSDNTSGYKGVAWNKNAKKWIVQIQVFGEALYLGIFSDIKEAIGVRRDAEIKYFGSFSCKLD